MSSSESPPVLNEVVRFLFVGILNSLFGYFVYAVTLYFSDQLTISLLVATVVGVLFNYKSTGSLVFRHNGESRLLKFVVVYSVIFVGNASLLYFLVSAGWDKYLSQLFLTPVAAIFSFFLFKSFVFVDHGEHLDAD